MGDGPGSVSNSARIAPREMVLTLRSFARGGGTLLDLEFLQDEKGRRLAAFGYHAGFAGAALALENWAWQLSRSCLLQARTIITDQCYRPKERAFSAGIELS